MKNNTQLNATEYAVLRILYDLAPVGTGAIGLPALLHTAVDSPLALNGTEIIDALRFLSSIGLATTLDGPWGDLWQATAAGGQAVDNRWR